MRVASAYPDPPFEVDRDRHTGFDAELMQALCAEIGTTWEPVDYAGDNFEGIFAGLAAGEYEAVISGTTVTDRRRELALFCEPYAQSGQSLVVNVERHPAVHSVEELAGLTVGIQHGNTSDLVARELKAAGKLGAIRYYAYRDIGQALDDLEAGAIDGFMKLAPVMHWLTRDRPALRVVQQDITRELLAVCVPLGRTDLQRQLDRAQRSLRQRGLLDELANKWLTGSGARLP